MKRTATQAANEALVREKREMAARIAELEAELKDFLFWTEDCGPHAEEIESIVRAALEGK